MSVDGGSVAVRMAKYVHSSNSLFFFLLFGVGFYGQPLLLSGIYLKSQKEGATMAKAKKTDRARAFDIYKAHDGKITAKEISKKLNISYRKVLSWKKEDDWEGLLKHYIKKKDNVQKDIIQTNNNPKLTDKERLFCMYYVRSFNAVKSYMKAFGVGYGTAAANSTRLLKKAKILEEIDNLKTARLTRQLLQEDDIFQAYIDIAFSDITDYVDFKTEQEPVIGPTGVIMVPDKTSKNKNAKVPLMQKTNKMYFKNSDTIDGTLISEIKEGRQGVSIKLHDKMKALQWLSDHLGILTDEQRARIELMKAKTAPPEQDQAEDDGFLDALKGTAAEDWDDQTISGDDADE